MHALVEAPGAVGGDRRGDLCLDLRRTALYHIASDGGPDSPLEAVITVEPARSAIDFASRAAPLGSMGRRRRAMRRVRRACRSLQPQRRRSKHRLWPVTPFEAWIHWRSHRRGGRGASPAASNKPRILTHVVQRGETISKIAAKYGIDNTRFWPPMICPMPT